MEHREREMKIENEKYAKEKRKKQSHRTKA